MKKSHSWNRVLSMMLCLCMVLSMIPGIPLFAHAQAGSYTLVTDISDILSGGEFVIVADNSGSALALGTSISGKIDPVTVTVDGNTVTGDNLPLWTLEATASGVALYNGTSYLGYKSSTNFASSDAPYEWGVTAGSNGGFVLNSTSATRGIYYQISGNRFGAYAQSNAENGEYISGLQLYKLSEGSDTPDVPEICAHAQQTVVPDKAATCTEEGLTEGSKCADCGEILTAQETIPATGHSFAEGSCTVCGAADPGSSAGTGYVLVTDISKVLSGGQFIIVADNGGTALALGTATSGKIDPVTVTVSGNTVIGSDLPVWTLEATAGGVALFNGTNYLGYSSSTNFASSDTPYEWGVTVGSNGGFVLNSTTATRGIYYQISGNRFGAYAQSNAENGEYISGLQLYKLSEGSDTPDIPQDCDHAQQTVIPGKDATCTKEGLTEGSKCADCGEILTAQEAIPATGHTEEVIPGKDPTCTENGLTDGVKCTVCGETVTQQKTIPATGHSFADGSCTVCGAADPGPSPVIGYVLVTDISKILSGGQFIIVADNGGTALALDTATSGKITPVTITVSGDTITGSDLPVWTLEATAGGVALFNGTNYLGYSSSTNFASSDAPYEWGVTVGSNGGFVLNSTTATRGIYYQISGGRFGAYAQSNAENGEYISGLQLYKLSEGSDTPDVPEDCDHAQQTVIPGKDATCTKEGLTEGSKCADCGEILTAQEAIPATGHTEEVIPGKDPTCTETGLTEGAKCTVCGETVTQQKTIPATGHSFVDGSCTVCGAADTGSSDEGAYTLVTDINQILTGGQFVIVADNSGSLMALGTAISGKIDAVEVVLDGSSELPVWTLESTAAGVALYNGTSYLGYSSSTNFAVSDVPYEWGVEAGSNGGFVLNSTSATRGIYYQISGNRFGAYAQSNADKPEYISGLQLYKLGGGSDTPDVPQDCDHSQKTVLPEKAPTCTETGLTEGSACSLCGEILVPQDAIPALGHTKEILPGKDATCTETGLTEGSQCTICGETVTAQTVIPATGHSFADGSCSICGTNSHITVYFRNNWLWTDVSLYFWGSSLDENPTWPGSAMRYYGTDGTYSIYSMKVPTDCTGLIINGKKDDGSGLDQTPDITGDWFDGILYSMEWNDGNQVSVGKISDQEIQTLPVLAFRSANLTLHDDLTINFKVDQSLIDGTYSNIYAVFTLDGKTTTVREYALKDGKYVFSFKNIAPYRMNDTVTAVLYGTHDGMEYTSEVFSYSVANYCYNMLGKYGTDNYAKLRTLLVDLLNYGAASQLYVDYHTEALVNASLTDTQKAWATATDRTWTTVQDLEYVRIPDPKAEWIGGGLVLKESISMRFKIRTNSVENLSVHILTESGTQFVIDTFEETDDGYYFYFQGLNAAQMSESVYLAVFEDDTMVSNTICYSIESYAYAQQNDSNTALVQLLKAMMKYGDAAKSYINT